jgi:hypothetical protein
VAVGYWNVSNFRHVYTPHIGPDEPPVSTRTGFALFLFVIFSEGHTGDALKCTSVKPASDRLISAEISGQLYTDSTVEGCTYC